MFREMVRVVGCAALVGYATGCAGSSGLGTEGEDALVSTECPTSVQTVLEANAETGFGYTAEALVSRYSNASVTWDDDPAPLGATVSDFTLTLAVGEGGVILSEDPTPLEGCASRALSVAVAGSLAWPELNIDVPLFERSQILVFDEDEPTVVFESAPAPATSTLESELASTLSEMGDGVELLSLSLAVRSDGATVGITTEDSDSTNSSTLQRGAVAFLE